MCVCVCMYIYIYSAAILPRRTSSSPRRTGKGLHVYTYIDIYAYIYIYTYMYISMCTALRIADAEVLPFCHAEQAAALNKHVKTRRWECDRPGVEPTSSGCIVRGQYRSSEKVSCDEWYWNPSPDISGFMRGARRVVRGLLLATKQV